MYWLDRTGALGRPLSDMPNAADAMREPSLQLVADEAGRSLDLVRLAEQGARIVGRLAAVDGARVRFQHDLARITAAADHQMGRLLERIDRHVDAHGLGSGVGIAEGWALTPQFDAPAEIDLDAAGIRSVVWATGYRRDYTWLDANVLDSRGELMNNRGVTPAPGLYVLGLQFMIRRNSSFIDGVGRDADEIAAAIARRADACAKEAA
jgi:putative flavoprotein involved in K+ transport